MKKQDRKEYWKAYKAKKRAEKSRVGGKVDKPEEKPEMIVDEPVIEVAVESTVTEDGMESRFKRQTCGACKRVWNSYTLLTECPYCRVETGAGDVDRNVVDRTPIGEWDREKYEDKAAWEIAVERTLRARKYAEAMPEQVSPGDMIFQSVEWQYWNEGLPAVRKAVFA